MTDNQATPRFPIPEGCVELGANDLMAVGDLFGWDFHADEPPGIVKGLAGTKVRSFSGRVFRPIPTPAAAPKATGLKDVTGREIYEGDTIEGILKVWNLGTMGEIVFDFDHAEWANKNEGGITPLEAIEKIKVIAPFIPKTEPKAAPEDSEALASSLVDVLSAENADLKAKLAKAREALREAFVYGMKCARPIETFFGTGQEYYAWIESEWDKFAARKADAGRGAV